MSYRSLKDSLDQNLTSNTRTLYDAFLAAEAQSHSGIHPDESISQRPTPITPIFKRKGPQEKKGSDNAEPSSTNTTSTDYQSRELEDETPALPPRILQSRTADILEGALSNRSRPWRRRSQNRHFGKQQAST